MDWVLTTNEILANVERLAAEERKASASKPAAVANGNGETVQPSDQHYKLVSRQSRFSVQAIFLKLPPPMPAGLEPPGRLVG